MINIVYMVDPSRGGWPTYTAHLIYGLREAGENVQLWKIGRQVGRESAFGRGLTYKLNTVENLMTSALAGEVVHIAAAHPSRAEAVGFLLNCGANITLHDPTELKGGMPEALAYAKKPVVCVRPAIQKHLKISSRFVPHPYKRYPGDYGTPRHWFAASFSRVDWDKGTHHIVKANLQLPIDKQIYIYGYRHRPYVKHNLDQLDPNWERNYVGGDWPITDYWTGMRYPEDGLWTGVKIAKGFRWALDMTAISGDGGGSQYTFLEALDGGASLVLNKAWLTGDDEQDAYMKGLASFVNAENLAAELVSMDAEWDGYDEHIGAPLVDEFLANHDAKTRALETIA